MAKTAFISAICFFIVLICFQNLFSSAALLNKSSGMLKSKLTSSEQSLLSGTSYYKTTKWEDRSEGNIYFLDRHFIQCPSALQGFKLNRSGDRIQYIFKCI